MLKEFKAFIMKGNVLELAVAVIIAGAFGVIVTSFTNDIIMPPIGMLLGGVDFNELAITLQEPVMNGEEVLTEGVFIRWGAFVQTIINFIIIAFVVFMVVRSYNRMNAEEEAPAPDPGPSEKDILIEIRDALVKRP